MNVINKGQTNVKRCLQGKRRSFDILFKTLQRLIIVSFFIMIGQFILE